MPCRRTRRSRHAFEPFALPKWRESSEFRAFVVSFGRLLPMEKPSPLADKAIIQKLMSLSAGLTGKVTTLLVQAAELAIRQRTECITLDLIEQAAKILAIGPRGRVILIRYSPWVTEQRYHLCQIKVQK